MKRWEDESNLIEEKEWEQSERDFRLNANCCYLSINSYCLSAQPEGYSELWDSGVNGVDGDGFAFRVSPPLNLKAKRRNSGGVEPIVVEPIVVEPDADAGGEDAVDRGLDPIGEHDNNGDCMYNGDDDEEEEEEDDENVRIGGGVLGCTNVG